MKVQPTGAWTRSMFLMNRPLKLSETAREELRLLVAGSDDMPEEILARLIHQERLQVERGGHHVPRVTP
jgi:hypothetical protein